MYNSLVACESDVEPLSGSILNLHIEIRPNARQCSQPCRMLLMIHVLHRFLNLITSFQIGPLLS